MTDMTDLTLTKSLPSHTEAERMILGVVLLDNPVLSQAAATLVDGDFFLPSHRKIYRAMITLWNKGVGIDPLTLQEELRKANQLDEIDGPAYIASLFDGVPRFSNIDAYVQLVLEKSKLRQVIRAANLAMQASMEDLEPPEVIADRARVQLEAICAGGTGLMRSQPIFRYMNEVFDSNVVPKTTPTGFSQLDNVLLGGGLGIGDLTVVAARTSRGKSTLAMQIAANVADKWDTGGDLSDRKVVLFFSIEMTGRSLARRIATVKAELGWDSVKKNAYTHEELYRLDNLRDRVNYWLLQVSEVRRLTPRDIANECRAVRRQLGRLDLVVVDYLGLVQTGQPPVQRHLEIAYLMRELKIMAGEPGIEAPFIVPVQISRSGAMEQEITLEHLKESGAIEESSDKVMILQEPKRKDIKSDGTGYRVTMTLAKQREGQTATIGYEFLTNFGGFKEIPGTLKTGAVRVKGVTAGDLHDEEEEVTASNEAF